MLSFRKGCLAALLGFLSIHSFAAAWQDCYECAPANRTYIGGFGGGLFSDSTKLSQMGTAFFTEAQGGPLAIFAEGSTKKTSSGFGGVQVGYEFVKSGNPEWSIAPAGELEAFFYSHKKKGHLINFGNDRLDEHDFLDSFDLDTSVILVNTVFSLKNPCWGGFSPYIGGGIGAAHLSLDKADSLQVSPDEPGINHFNSKNKDTTWAFAAQIKAGLSYAICDSFHLFAEYRYVFIDSSNYILGPTIYSTHAATSQWNVKVKDMSYNAFVIGLQYDL